MNYFSLKELEGVNKLKKKALMCIGLSAMIILSTTIPSTTYAVTTTNSIKDNENRLQFIQNQLNSTAQAIEQLNQKSSFVEDEARQIDGLVLEVEREISAIESEIYKAETGLEGIQFEKSVLANNLTAAKEEFQRTTAHLTGEDKEYMDYVLLANDPETLNNRIEQLNMAYSIYQSAVEKYEKEFVNTQAKEGTILIEKEQLEKNRAIVLKKKDFVQEQLNKKNELLGQINHEKEEYHNAHEEMADVSNELETIISDLQEEQRRAEEEAARLAAEQAGSNSSSSSDSGGYDKIDSKMTGKLHWPSDSSTKVTSNFGGRVDPITGKSNGNHKGTDISAKSGTGVLAGDDGTVIYSGWIKGYGNTIIIDHGGGISTLYGHNSKLVVKSGVKVDRGQKVAEVGSTGRSTGPHIHFEVRINGKQVDPLPYLQ